MVIAYLLKRLPATFGVACRIFTEIKFRLPEKNFASFLEFGACLGGASSAFNDIFPESEKMIAIEACPNLRKLGKHMT